MNIAFPLFSAALLALALRAVAADPDVTKEAPKKPLGPNIFIELQIVSLPQKTAMPLVRDLSDSAKAETAYQEIQKLLGEDAAQLLGWPMLTTASGSTAKIEMTHELRYATEYDPGSIQRPPLPVQVDQTSNNPEGKTIFVDSLPTPHLLRVQKHGSDIGN